MECIFCKIIKKELPSDIVYEDDKFIAFKDIHPKAPVHLLLVPKNHLESVNNLDENNKEIIADLFLLAKEIAKEQKIADGYHLHFNVGRKGGQLVDHLHLHLEGGWH